MNVVSSAQHSCWELQVPLEPARVSPGVAGHGCGGHLNPDPCLHQSLQTWVSSSRARAGTGARKPTAGTPGGDPHPWSLRSVLVDAGTRCVGRPLAPSHPSSVFIGKVTREFMNGPDTDPSPKVKVWELAGGVLQDDYLPLREKGINISIHVYTLCLFHRPFPLLDKTFSVKPQKPLAGDRRCECHCQSPGCKVQFTR